MVGRVLKNFIYIYNINVYTHTFFFSSPEGQSLVSKDMWKFEVMFELVHLGSKL